MTTAEILGALKYVGLIITALSGVWALIAKTTFEDAEGRKRLTAQGHASVAIIIASALVGMLAYGFETLAKQDADRIATDKEQRAAEVTRQKEAETKAESDARARHQIELMRIQEADRKAGEADQRYLFLKNAAEEKDRQLDIAQRVSRGSEQNLERAQVALHQLRRLLNPIGMPEITAVFALRADAPGVSPLFERLATFGRLIQANPSLAETTPGISVGTRRQNVPIAIDIAPSATLFPRRDEEPELYTLLTGTGAQISIFGDDEDQARIKGLIGAMSERPSLGMFGTEGDVGFDITTDKPDAVRVSYELETRQILIWVTGIPEPRFYRQTGEVVSVLDLERSTFVIAAEDVLYPSLTGHFPTLRAARKHLRPDIVFLKAGGRNYTLRGFSAVQTRSGYPAFLVGPVGRGVDGK